MELFEWVIASMAAATVIAIVHIAAGTERRRAVFYSAMFAATMIGSRTLLDIDGVPGLALLLAFAVVLMLGAVWMERRWIGRA